MRKKIFSIFALGALLLTASCSLHDDNEIFDTPAAQRMEETIANDKALLESATNGWELHLWMGDDYSAGGYTYFLKFANDKVTVASEIADADMTTSSSYGIVADEGPVLTINTYNEIFHDLANPESDGSEVGQDYEFIITRTTNDSIYLTGKKYGNKMAMTRVPEGVSWSEKLEQIAAMEDNMMATFKLCNGADSIGTAALDADTRNLEIETDSGTVDIPYYVATDGIVLQKPLSINGMNAQNLIYNDDAMSFTTTDAGATALNMQVVFPTGYMFYDEYPGTWTLTWAGGTARTTVTLTPAGDNKTYKMSGLIPGYDVVVNYHKPTGRMRILAQFITNTSSGNSIYMLTTDGSSFWFSLSAGFSLRKWSNRWVTQYVFDDLTGNGITGFLLWEFTGAPSSSTSVGFPSTVTFTGGSLLLSQLMNMRKVN